MVDIQINGGNQYEYRVLEDVGLSYKKTEIEECLKLRYENTSSSCIVRVDYLYCLISRKLEIIVCKIHVIHNTQYVILSDLLQLLSHVECYLNLCIKRLLIEEHKVRLKLDDLSTKKLRTKNTVKTSERLRLSKDLQKLVHDDLEGLRAMREATFCTLDSIITDRANTWDTGATLTFLAHRIQNTFPSSACCVTNGNHQQFVYNNIQYTSDLSVTMDDCHRFLQENECLNVIIQKNNVLRRYQRNLKHKIESDEVVCSDDDVKDMGILYFDNLDDKGNKNGLNAQKRLNLTDEFKTLQKKLNGTIDDMNKHCSTLQQLLQLKNRMGKRLVEIVKFHWK
eukprot:49021_1